MRKMILAAGLGLLFSMAALAAPDEQTPEARAYFSFSFGGDKPGVRALHYGLRLDHDRFFVPSDQSLPALMQLDFSRRGLSAIQVNGLNVLRPAYRMSQNEDQSKEATDEEIAEEETGFFEGIFSGIAGFFGGLFGDDEEAETEVADADAASGEAAAADDSDDGLAAEDGPFLTYDAVDWGLLAVGLAGIGFIATEVVDGNDDPNPTAAPPAGGTPCTINPTPLNPGGTPSGCTPTAFTGRLGVGPADAGHDSERDAWLNSGTGQMGDLQARD